MIRYHILFRGHVQQVGFRYYSMTFAGENNCTGWVKNNDDGSVEMEIQGTDSQINQVIASLQSIQHIKIKTIDKIEIPLQHESGFHLKF